MMDPPVAALPLAGAAADGGGVYRVLARKYRPQTFAQLIGQGAMVQTLANAISRDRLAHAFVLTGVRGVGKTSTARLIAKALNCIGPDGTGGPTIDPCGLCENCKAIAEGRHIDVIEMDAASHTGVDDIREIIDAVRYAAVTARFKIYIIDEVHMLSKSAFNALLKTLEEPPPHVKFLFATTEVAKIPVTILSRCQRFDLRRIGAQSLFEHFRGVLTAEQVTAEDTAIQIVADAAEGSVRDGLSMLDQAIAHADPAHGGTVTAAQVRAMLGLSDSESAGQVLDALLTGDGAAALALATDQYQGGSEPVAIVRALMELVHDIAMAKVAPRDNPAWTAVQRVRIGVLADRLGVAALSRLWQMLVAGHGEVLHAASPLDHLDMLLLRIAHAASLPDPDALARLLQGGAPFHAPAPAPLPAAPQPDVDDATTAVLPLDAAGIFALLEGAGEHRLAEIFRLEGQLVVRTDGQLQLTRTAVIDQDIADGIARVISAAVGTRVRAMLVDQPGVPSLAQQDAAAVAAEQAARSTPAARAVLDQFPHAKPTPTPSQDKGPTA